MTKCICKAGCDCQNPDPQPGSARLISENCPVHNWRPYPVPGCPVVGIHVNGAIDSDDTIQVPKRTREEAAEVEDQKGDTTVSAPCSKCPNLTQDSMGSDFGLCQDCWEAECSESWWCMADRFPGAVCPVDETASTRESE